MFGSLVPYRQVKSLLEAQGCTEKPDGARPDGHWWTDPRGNDFFVPILNPAGEVPEFALKNFLVDLIRLGQVGI